MKQTSPTRVLGWSAATWGVVVRLWPLVTGSFEQESGPLSWLSLVGNLSFFGYAEGYRAFQSSSRRGSSHAR